jgi:hypothetical protein
MSFPWPAAGDDLVLDAALDIAMRHFNLPSGEEQYADLESFAGAAIMEDWRRGVRNKTLLANKAIADVEQHHPLGMKLRRIP